MKESYPIVLIPEAEGGFCVLVPDIDGCITQGDTVEEAIANAKDAIELMLEDYRERGLAAPRATSRIMNVDVQISA